MCGLGVVIDVNRYGWRGGCVKMLTDNDIEEALRWWIIYEQDGNFEQLKHSLKVYTETKKIFLRVKSPITEAIELDYNKKYPLLLRNELLHTNLY